MKHYNLKQLMGCFLTIALLGACSQNDDVEPVPPTISAINPNIGPVGLEVVISGTNFKTVTSGNQVIFVGIEAEISSASATQLVATIPEGATTGEVIVRVGETSAIGPVFTVTASPQVIGFSPAQATVGTLISIEGEAFMRRDGEPEEAEYVLFNGLKGDIQQFSNNKIIVEVPREATSGPLILGVRGIEVEIGTFEVLEVTLSYEDNVTVSTVIEVADLSNVFVTSKGDVILSTDDQVLRLNTDNTLTNVAGIDGNSSYQDGSVATATFVDPYQIVEIEENDFLVNDLGEGVIRRIVNGEVSTYYSNENFFLLLGLSLIHI